VGYFSTETVGYF